MLDESLMRSHCEGLRRSEIDVPQFVERCTRAIAQGLGCSRVGLWTFYEHEGGQAIRCRGLHDRIAGRMALAPDERGDAVNGYVDMLMDAGHVVFDDVRAHPVTAGMFVSGKARRVRSLMAACFSANGRVLGAYSCTQLDEPRRWTPQQLLFLKRFCSKANLALAIAARTQPSSMLLGL